jgi:phosphatidylethanolamine-binding protein (PEBP) family uncharacterized protein
MPEQARPSLKDVTTAALALAALALIGCGSGSKPATSGAAASATKTAATSEPSTSTAPSGASTPTTTTSTTTPAASTHTATAEHTPLPREGFAITSPAVHNGVLAARYTCDGEDAALPLHIEGVPPGTAELMLDVIKIKPVGNALYFPWAVTHIKPTTRTIVDGKLPAGAVVGRNGAGQTSYHLCPPKGAQESYVAVLFALPHKLAAKPGFDPAALRREAEHTASYQNLYIFGYKRR